MKLPFERTACFALGVMLTVAATAPAKADGFPQWLPASADGTVQIDYNSIRVSAEGTRSVDIDVKPVGSGVFHVSCSKWKQAITANGYTTSWDIIRPGSSQETAAYIMCPGPEQQAAIKVVQALKNGTPTAPAAAVDDGMVRMNGKVYNSVGEAICDPAFYNVLHNNCPNRY